MTKLLLFSIGNVGSTMSGPGIRYFHFAKELAGEFEVTLMTPNAPDVPLNGVEIVETESMSPRALNLALDRFDVIVAQRLPLSTMRYLVRSGLRVIYDLYVPFLSEQLAMLDAEQTTPADVLFHESSMLQLRFALQSGSAFVCASERQRDFWLGMLGALGRLDLDQYREEPNLRNLIDVVPFGLPADPPVSEAPVLRGVHPGIGESDRILLWAGGIWNWFDPLTVIRAMRELRRSQEDVKLVFLGTKHPQVPHMMMGRRALELARSLGLLDRTIFFRPDWVPYAERGRFLLEADVGVSAHFDTVETRYAFRTRILDHFWAALPTITTRGDVLADLVAERELGRVVDFEDVAGWTAAIEALLDDDAERHRVRLNLMQVSEEFAWPKVVEPLARLAVAASPPSHRAQRTVIDLEERWLRFRTSLALGGPAGLARRQGVKLARRARRLGQPS